ncbi:MAG: putative phage abortive infection protein [Pedobacter sp.]|uniref:putative phage abortive infection protein n=1 Tax=Pedobacter sp. TaxID=1411316 RepID=UPI003567048C
MAFFAPFLFTRDSATEDFDFTQTGAIGDTIGGLMNPFIALAGVIVTGLAFYMQYRANLLQRELFNIQSKNDKESFEEEIKLNKEQFQQQILSQEKQNKIQQFESQFYEMVRLHKENVNEIEIPAKRNISEGRPFRFESHTVTKRNAFLEFKKEFETILKQIPKCELREINQETIKEAYGYFFWGLGEEHLESEDQVAAQLHHDDNSLSNILSKLKNHQFASRHDSNSNLNFNIVAFEGHSGILGHYFRHLYHTVKFVVDQKDDFLSYKNKIKYLKVLRAQLSNYEQIMLFYNWLAGYGESWENDENRYFTEYKMIHNLWFKDMLNNTFINEKIDELRQKPVLLRKKSRMYEIDGK